MRTEQAVNNFLEAKQGKSPHTLAQYCRAMDYLNRGAPEMPKKPGEEKPSA